MITLPVNIIRKMGWRKGQKVEITEYGDGVRIRDWKTDDQEE